VSAAEPGLALFLRQAAERLADRTTLDRSFLAELDTWLAQLPILADAELTFPKLQRS
jgi:hypothetical protein